MELKKCIILSCLLIIFHGCSSVQTVDDNYLNLHSSHIIALPGKPWEVVKIDSEDLAMQHQKSNAMFAIFSHPAANSKIELERLYKQLFIGIKKKHIVNRQHNYINNQRFLHTILEGELDNHKIKISAYIICTENFVYDIVYWSTPDAFDLSLKDFERAIKSFQPVN